MYKLTRRSFGKLVVAGSIPLLRTPLAEDQQTQYSGPDTIAGHSLSSEEKNLAQKFLRDH